jgi:alpha-amylase/alpha-mannosidase (GH57 family)
MPWAYLHATKDYLGMVELAAEFPGVHQTFNLVPSLILQIEEYAAGEAKDSLFDLAFAPAEELDAAGRALVQQKFFPAPVATMIEPYPRYRELLGRRHEGLSDQELRDIQKERISASTTRRSSACWRCGPSAKSFRRTAARSRKEPSRFPPPPSITRSCRF